MSFPAQAAIEEFDRTLELLVRKNAAYGAQNISLTGLQGVTVRALDKTMRLKNLVLDGGPGAGDESVEDTLRDLLGYALIGLLIQRGKWGEGEIIHGPQ